MSTLTCHSSTSTSRFRRPIPSSVSPTSSSPTTSSASLASRRRPSASTRSRRTSPEEFFAAKAAGRGPAAEIADYAELLLDATVGSPQQVQRAMSMAMAFWNLAIVKDDGKRRSRLDSRLNEIVTTAFDTKMNEKTPEHVPREIHISRWRTSSTSSSRRADAGERRPGALNESRRRLSSRGTAPRPLAISRRRSTRSKLTLDRPANEGAPPRGAGARLKSVDGHTCTRRGGESMFEAPASPSARPGNARTCRIERARIEEVCRKRERGWRQSAAPTLVSER